MDKIEKKKKDKFNEIIMISKITIFPRSVEFQASIMYTQEDLAFFNTFEPQINLVWPWKIFVVALAGSRNIYCTISEPSSENWFSHTLHALQSGC